MNEGPVNQGAMIETTDCLEAAGVFRGWKNLFFLIVVVCLLLTQGVFWLVDQRIVPAGGKGSNAAASAAPADANAVPTVAAGAPADANHPSGRVAAAAKLPARLLGKLDAGHLARTVELVNGVLIVAVVVIFFNDASLFILLFFLFVFVYLDDRGEAHLVLAHLVQYDVEEPDVLDVALHAADADAVAHVERETAGTWASRWWAARSNRCRKPSASPDEDGRME